eukprot:808261-Prymnesium_polylepis.1
MVVAGAGAAHNGRPYRGCLESVPHGLVSLQPASRDQPAKLRQRAAEAFMVVEHKVSFSPHAALVQQELRLCWQLGRILLVR